MARRVTGVPPVEAARQFVLWRIERNLARTGHPHHHLTADGSVVDGDPTLEDMIAHLPDVKPAVPVDRGHYGVELYPQHGKV
jgi:hypothetical protein